MKNYIYQNDLVGKKQLREILSWSFTNYDSMQACSLADELKYLGFKYATIAGISISIEDLQVPFIKNLMLVKANQEIINSEKIFLKGKITEVEQFQKIIDTWSLTSESLKEQVLNYFKKYDPLNSVYIMAFSGARGNLSQVRQLVGMRGLMSDPSGEIMNLPIKHNFREGLTITDYLMSGYGARKGIVDTALKTANSGYLTRRLIDIAQDILIREKDCKTNHSVLIFNSAFSKKIIGRILSKSLIDPKTLKIIAEKNTQITPLLLQLIKQKKIAQLYLRSPLTCDLYRAICQQCYGWDLSTENIVDIGEAVGILAGQSIGEPGTQLTMRTFHTGGIFTSEARQQVLSPVNGIIRFSKFLETVVLRTNRGEEVLVTKNSGSLILIPDSSNVNVRKIEVSRNTILFPKHNQYIEKDIVIAELINTNKQLKREIKPIVSTTSGQIIIPKIKNRLDSLNNNKLIWLLSSQLYNSPENSYINFYSDYKLNKNSYIFRTKIINSYPGFVEYENFDETSYKCQIFIQNNSYSLLDASFSQLSEAINNSTSILNINKRQYLLYTTVKKLKTFLKVTRKQKFAKLINNAFLTKTGGILFYDWQIIYRFDNSNNKVYFCDHKNDYKVFINRDNNKKSKFHLKDTDQHNDLEQNFVFPKNFYRTLVWLEEETHNVKCRPNILLVKNGDFISKNFEIIPNQFSKTSGLVSISQKNNTIQTLKIKSGLIYEGKKISTKVMGKKFSLKTKKLFFPGEQIFSTIIITNPSICEQINGKNGVQLVIRLIQLYEFPKTQKIHHVFKNQSLNKQILKINTNVNFVYQPNQYIKTNQNLNLITQFLHFETGQSFSKNLSIQLANNKKYKSVDLQIIKKLNLNDYLLPTLKYKNLHSCPVIQKNQFIDNYTTLIYLESLTPNPLEIVKFKINKQSMKQILLISNNDCINIRKRNLPLKKVNDFVTNSLNTNHVGKIIIENDKFFTIQKGRPYFFPKCKITEVNKQSKLQYKIIPLKRIQKKVKINRKLFLHNYDRLKALVETNPKVYLNNSSNWQSISDSLDFSLKIKFTKMFLKQNGKLYSCMIPRFFKQFTIGSKSRGSIGKSLINLKLFQYPKKAQLKLDRTMLIQDFDIDLQNFQHPSLTLIKFMEYPFKKSTKSISLYSITEDFFEQELNSVFCQNNQFLENGATIGLLNLEKEITGDIVQGLPRIEEILEARKKNQVIKRIPTSQKKSLLTQSTSLDENFEFHKLGTPMKENDRINPHKLVKVYFNYYGFIKPFFCDRKNNVKYSRLTTNFEGNYKSFKKVQSFILNSVQGVYESQGVIINNKHVEVIIKQMTTKVLITDEGDTPLLKREVIDLYHIQYINRIVEKEQKQIAYFLPLLFGITRAALNNPSFISAASFQETTRVLTKAAIEGRIDWLRGLKENIIIGHLIPAGTGSRNFKTSFKKPILTHR